MPKTTAAAATFLWLLTVFSLACGDSPAPPPAAESASPQASSHGEVEQPPVIVTPPKAASGVIFQTLREPDPYVRIARLATLLPGLGPEDVKDAEVAVQSPSVTISAGEIELLTRFWATHEPRPANLWASRRSPIAYRAAATLAALETWSRSDPMSAFHTVQALQMGGATNADVAQIALIRGWYEGGKDGLEDYIYGLGPTIEQQRAIATLARRMIEREGAVAATTWAAGVSDDDPTFKLAVYRQLASELAQLDVQAAVDWCVEACKGPYNKGVRPLIAQRWAAQDGPAAMEWVSHVPPGPAADLAVKGAFRGFWRHDREGMEAWTEELTRDGVPAWYQPALENYAGAVGRRQPQEGLKWALLIEDPETRERATVEAVRRWRKRDESAAEAWIAQSSLSEKAIWRIRTSPKKGDVFPGDLKPEDPEPAPE